MSPSCSVERSLALLERSPENKIKVPKAALVAFIAAKSRASLCVFAAGKRGLALLSPGRWMKPAPGTKSGGGGGLRPHLTVFLLLFLLDVHTKKVRKVPPGLPSSVSDSVPASSCAGGRRRAARERSPSPAASGRLPGPDLQNPESNVIS